MLFYTKFISKKQLDKMSFDFYLNGKDKFKERAEFYDYVLRELINKKYLNDSFIAGDFFLKYQKKEFDCEELYEELSYNQPIDIYIYIKKNVNQLNHDEMLRTINEKYRIEAQIDNSVRYKNVFGTFHLKLNLEEVKHVRLHICYKKCEDLMKNFMFSPHKIGYVYGSKEIITGNWFVQGGNLGIIPLEFDCRKKNLTDELFKENSIWVDFSF